MNLEKVARSYKDKKYFKRSLGPLRGNTLSELFFTNELATFKEKNR